MTIVSAEKRVSFKSPYSGKTFQKITQDLLGRDGFVSGGASSDSGGVITVSPFRIVQRGIVAETTEDATLTSPAGAEPWFVVAAVPDDGLDSGVVVTVTKDLVQLQSAIVVAFKANGRWLNPVSVDIAGAAQSSNSGEVGIEGGFDVAPSIDGSRNVTGIRLGSGSVVDSESNRRRILPQEGEANLISEFTPVRPHETKDRIDLLVLRHRKNEPPSVIEAMLGTADGETSADVGFANSDIRPAYFSKRGGVAGSEWYAYGDGNDLEIRGGRASELFADTTLLTASGVVGGVWIAGQRSVDDAIVLLYIDGTNLRVVSFNAATGAQIDAPVTIDTQANATSHVRGELDSNETLHVVFEHTDSNQQVYFGRFSVVAGGTFGTAAVSPRIVSGAETGRNDTWPDVAVDSFGKTHIVYTSGSGSNEFGDFVYAVIDASGNLESKIQHAPGAAVGYQADAFDNIGFAARAYTAFYRARVCLNPHDEVFAALLGDPTSGDGSGSVSSPLLFSHGFSDRFGFPIVNVDTAIPSGDFVACDVFSNETCDLRFLAVSYNSTGNVWTEKAFALDTVFAANGKIEGSKMFEATWFSASGVTNFGDESRDAFLGLGPAGDMVSVVDINAGSFARHTGRMPGSSSTSRRRPTAHPRDVFLANYLIPANASVIPTDDGVFGVFSTRPKNLSFPFLAGSKGGSHTGFDAIHEALVAANQVGGEVIIRPGEWNFSGRNWVDGTLALRSGVSLVGEGSAALRGVTIQVGSAVSYVIAGITGSVVEVAAAILPGFVRPGDHVLFDTGMIHRIKAILPPVVGGSLGRYLLDNNADGATPTGAEVSFEVLHTGTRVENLTIDGRLLFSSTMASAIKGCRLIREIVSTEATVQLSGCYRFLAEDLDYTQAEVSDAGYYLSAAGGRGLTIRNLRAKDGLARILIGDNVEDVAMENVSGDGSIPGTAITSISNTRSTPIMLVNVGSPQISTGGPNVVTVVPGRVVAAESSAVIAFEDTNTRAGAITDDAIKLTSGSAQQFNSATSDVIVAAVNERLRVAGDTLAGDLIPDATDTRDLGTLALRFNAFLNSIDAKRIAAETGLLAPDDVDDHALRLSGLSGQEAAVLKPVGRTPSPSQGLWCLDAFGLPRRQGLYAYYDFDDEVIGSDPNPDQWTVVRIDGFATKEAGGILQLETDGLSAFGQIDVTSHSQFRLASGLLLNFRAKIADVTNGSSRFGLSPNFHFFTGSSGDLHVGETSSTNNVDTGIDLVSDTWYLFSLYALSTTSVGWCVANAGDSEDYSNLTILGSGVATLTALPTTMQSLYAFVSTSFLQNPMRLSIDFIEACQFSRVIS